jgi:predicted sugar kinase
MDKLKPSLIVASFEQAGQALEQVQQVEELAQQVEELVQKDVDTFVELYREMRIGDHGYFERYIFVVTLVESSYARFVL